VNNRKFRVLWIDDEIDMLKSHFIFLESRGYLIHPCSNGIEAISILKNTKMDLVLLDENMPGLNGFETLSIIKQKKPNLPVIMVTKNEEERIIDDAIGSKVSDYLIKPVNPNQILHSLKKILNQKSLISEKATDQYQKDFKKISLDILNADSYIEWVELYKKFVYWKIELMEVENNSMLNILENQLKEANLVFGKFIKSHYLNWINSMEKSPTLSHNVFKKKIVPNLKKNDSTLLILIDNLRLDQWKIIEPLISKYFNIDKEDLYCSILPTTTHYSRNSFFAGLTPIEIKAHFPDLWVDDIQKVSKNSNENELLSKQLEALSIKGNFEYFKIVSSIDAKRMLMNLRDLKKNTLNTIVYNFVDILSHAKTEMNIIKELAFEDKGYLSLTFSWFKNSTLYKLIQKASELDFHLVITTDHGTINVTNPIEIIGNKETSFNLRYKYGKGLKFPEKKVFEISDPINYRLPKNSHEDKYVFALGNTYFIYPNKFNEYAKHFMNSYQHGGVSLQEMLVPLIELSPR
tara:strand:+ start:7183 stop:8739 length:1557 start_codon:yes stop_codon:yes gene_type:complete